ncbi:D-alanyl-D-alanine carboxypeptidase family protein [Anaeromicrobium sediminis]|uniref:D-alanyl-D-alanine carboxypeptidase family protein n=1 Tax=Anaeromicrobium sediminis TaxID=1478221 RepID=UPI001594FDAC|nr:D-alanyl-D-alanine carboxypeptidase family protein [Anaeromicrobium sediminis]
MKKNLTTFILVFILLFNVLFSTNAFAVSKPTISAPSGILIDFETGDVLYDKNGNTPMYPASTTKVMTALLTLENCKLDEVVTIDSKSPFTNGSRIYLNEGEKVTIEQLLYALLVESANDAAVALAIHISGDVKSFAGLMNERAKELGAKNTNFTNPNGLPDPKHITTAYDLALIGKKAMEIEKFREIVKTTRYQIPPTNKQEETRYLKNSNRLLWGTGSRNKMEYKGDLIDIKYDIVDGMKTGYTVAAQQCLVATAQKDGHRVISVVLKATGKNIYSDTRTLLDYGFGNFKTIKLTSGNQKIKSIYINNDKSLNVNLLTKDTLYKTVPKDNSYDIEKKVEIFDEIKLPIEKGQVLGEIVYTNNDVEFGKVDLISDRSVEEKKLFSNFNIGKIFLIGFLSLIILFLIYRTFVTMGRIKRRKIRKRKLERYKQVNIYKK